MFKTLLCVPLLKMCLNKTRTNYLRDKSKIFIRSEGTYLTNPTIKVNFASYSTEDVNKILTAINNSDLNSLLSYDLAKTRATKLLSWRLRNGLLKDLDSILSVESFNVKFANKFFGSILNGSKDTKTLTQNKTLIKKVRKSPFIIPKIESTQRLNMKSCVSVDIGVNSISWSRLQLPEKEYNGNESISENVNKHDAILLTHWEHHRITDELNKLHLGDLVQRCLCIISNIPIADCYVLENPQIVQTNRSNTNAITQNINIQKAQMGAMVGLSLTSRNPFYENDVKTSKIPAKYVPNIFYMRRNITPRLFKYLIGMERVSSQKNVHHMLHESLKLPEIMDKDKDMEFVPRGRIQFPNQLKSFFSNASPSTRECLSQTLLLNLAFVRLILLEDPYSLNLLNSANAAQPKTVK